MFCLGNLDKVFIITSFWILHKNIWKINLSNYEGRDLTYAIITKLGQNYLLSQWMQNIIVQIYLNKRFYFRNYNILILRMCEIYIFFLKKEEHEFYQNK